MTTKIGVRKPSLKQRIEIASFALFDEMGIGNVTVDSIAGAAKTNKMGVYRNFASKEALIEVWLGNRIQQYQAIFDELEFKFYDDPLAQLRGFAECVVQNLPAIADRGCPFVNTLAETRDIKNPLSQRILAHKKKQVERLTLLCKNANFKNPEMLASRLTFILEGAQISAQNGSIEDIGDKVMKIVEEIISTI